MKNPALRQESRYEPAAVIPLEQEPSLLDWLKARNRIMFRETKETDELMVDEQDISELMDVDDDSYVDDDDAFSDDED